MTGIRVGLRVKEGTEKGAAARAALFSSLTAKLRSCSITCGSSAASRSSRGSEAFLAGVLAARSCSPAAPGSARRRCGRRGSTPPARSGCACVVARPSGAEARHSFAGLIDLFDGIDIGRPAGSAAVGAGGGAAARRARRARRAAGDRARRAQQAALARSAAGGDRRPPVARPRLRRGAGLRRAAARGRAASRFLLARRPGRRPPLERALEGRPLERLEVGPLGLDDTRRLLAERLGLDACRGRSCAGSPTRRSATRCSRSRSAARWPSAERAGGEIPLPDAVEDLLGTRVAGPAGRAAAGPARGRAGRRPAPGRARGGGRRRGRRRRRPAARRGRTRPRRRTRCSARRRASTRGRASAASCTARSPMRSPARSGAPATSRWRPSSRTPGWRTPSPPPRTARRRAAPRPRPSELAEHALRLTPRGRGRSASSGCSRSPTSSRRRASGGG